MKERLREVFALRDNPFNPVFEFDADDPTFSDLGRRPLAVHRQRQLDELYCENAGPFRQHVESFRRELEWKGFGLGPPISRKGMNRITLIAGDRGTGKTTLASKMIQVVRQYEPPDRSPWKTFDRMMGFDRSAIHFREAVQALNDDIAAGSGLNDYCCILVDNVRQSLLADALDVFDRWDGKRWIFLFLTTSDLALIRSRFTNSARPINKYETRTLDADDAVAYVDHRIAHFRDPELEALHGDLRLYPYDEQNIRDSVERLHRPAGDGESMERESEDPITLRVFNGYLDRNLKDRFGTIADPDYNIGTLSPDQLFTSRIDLGAGGGGR